MVRSKYSAHIVLIRLISVRGSLWWFQNGMVNFTLTSTFSSSLMCYSSLKLVHKISILFLMTAKIIPTCLICTRSYNLQSSKTDIFQNAYIFSSKLGGIISQGLNLTHFLHLVAHKIQYLTRCAPIAGIGLIFAGRIKGHMKTRFVPKMNALCVSSPLNRILDHGYISSVSSLGLLGVKVGTIH